MKNIHINKAEIKDLVDVYKWRNNLISRRMFKNHSRVEYFKHRLWFFNSLRNKDIFLTICKKHDDGFVKIGIVRFDYFKNKKSAEVSINISPQMRGKGLGFLCLKKSIILFKQKFVECKYLTAYVKFKNIPSIKLFNNYGFQILNKKKQFLTLIFSFYK